jgi:hypothetical protein
MSEHDSSESEGSEKSGRKETRFLRLGAGQRVLSEFRRRRERTVRGGVENRTLEWRPNPRPFLVTHKTGPVRQGLTIWEAAAMMDRAAADGRESNPGEGSRRGFFPR